MTLLALATPEMFTLYDAEAPEVDEVAVAAMSERARPDFCWVFIASLSPDCWAGGGVLKPEILDNRLLTAGTAMVVFLMIDAWIVFAV